MTQQLAARKGYKCPTNILQRFPFSGVLVINIGACSPAARQRTGAAISGAATGAAEASAPQSFSKVMIFGGQDHKTYLGCLSCNEYASDSVYNSYGNSGSPFSTQSIWSHYSEYGSPYSSYSACKPYASDPPVIVDQNGIFYGRLTLNEYHPQRGSGARYSDWLKVKVCGNQ